MICLMLTPPHEELALISEEDSSECFIALWPHFPGLRIGVTDQNAALTLEEGPGKAGRKTFPGLGELKLRRFPGLHCKLTQAVNSCCGQNSPGKPNWLHL